MTQADAAARATLARAEALSQAGDDDAALRALQPLLDGATAPFEVRWLAAVLHERRAQYDEASQQIEALAARVPWHADLQNARGRLRAHQGRAAEALALFDEVLAREPHNADALFNRGNALRLLIRREEAIDAYRAVLPLHAGYAQAALLEIARQQQALQDFAGARISYLQLYHASGGSLDSIGYRLANEHHLWPPDPAATAQLARELGERYAAQVPSVPLPPAAVREAGRRLRIGLVSADLWSHPVGYFLEPLLASAAAQQADWFVYASRKPDADPLTARLRARASVWHEVAAWDDPRLARQVRDDGVDVLVDLAGYSAHHRLAAFAARPAPLQLSWLGYHGTTGLPYIDAVIADPVCVPHDESHFFSEPLLRLPSTRLCFAPHPAAPPIAPAPVLRHGAVTFGCVQRAEKIGAPVLAAWARIANALPQARWVLVVGDAESDGSDHDRLRRRAAAAGFAPAQLQILGRQPYADYLAGYAQVDLLLDTFPYPGGTTTAEALWQGVPTLTLSVPGMLGRQGEQILKAAGMPQWVTYSEDDYVATAVERGRSAPTAAWSALRPGMRERLVATPLFDAERFGRDWMSAVQSLWQDRAGQAQDRSAERAPRSPRIVFLVPEVRGPTGGVKVICEHAARLREQGFDAWLYLPSGSNADSFWDLQVPALPDWRPAADDLVIVPEVMPGASIADVRRHGCRIVLLVQNWITAHECLTGWPDPGTPPFDAVIAVSRVTQELAQRYLPQLPCWTVPPAVPLFAAPIPSGEGAAQEAIAIMPRKRPADAAYLRRMWPIAFPDLADVPWVEIDDLSHAEVMARLRRARYFVSLQDREGFGLPALEAMAAGCLVLGFTGLGGDEYANADNGVWLAGDRVPELLDALASAIRQERRNPGCHDAMRAAAQAMAAQYSLDQQAINVSQAYTAIIQHRSIPDLHPR